MNINELQSAALSAFDAIGDAYRMGNEAGNGFAVGDAGDSPEYAIESEGWALIWRRQHDDDCAIGITPDGRVVAVADIGGPWAVDVTEVVAGN